MAIPKPEQILEKAIKTLRKLELDLDELCDDWNRAEQESIYAILAPLAAQSQHISNDEELLNVAHDLISAFEAHPTLRKEFFGNINPDANRKARGVSIKQHKKEQKKLRLTGHKEVPTVANNIHTRITQTMAKLKPKEEAQEPKKR